MITTADGLGVSASHLIGHTVVAATEEQLEGTDLHHRERVIFGRITLAFDNGTTAIFESTDAELDSETIRPNGTTEHAPT